MPKTTYQLDVSDAEVYEIANRVRWMPGEITDCRHESALDKDPMSDELVFNLLRQIIERGSPEQREQIAWAVGGIHRRDQRIQELEAQHNAFLRENQDNSEPTE
jgi:hypothetical protein